MQIKDVFLRTVPFLLVGSLFSCSKSSDNAGGTPPPPANDITLVTDSKFGSILVNATGQTLYFFSPDANGSSACTGDCLTTWPVVNYDNLTLGTGLTATDFATITRSDGAKQTTYKGWPLYTYAGDSGPSTGGAYGGTATPGTTKGDGINGVWFVAKPDYTIMLAKTQLVGADGVSYTSDFTAGTGATLYMTDDHGNTLYAFSHDKAGTNNYTVSDFSNDSFWPIVHLTGVQNVPSALSKADFGTITVFTRPQLTYKGWPVYYFGADAMTRGNTKGVSVPAPGIWPVMNQSSPLAPTP